MSWPTTPSKVHIDAGTDDPGQARAELSALVDIVNSIVDARDTAGGVPSLDSSGLIPEEQIDISAIPGVPVGGMLPYLGGGLPTGFLFCDGSEVSRSNFQALFSVIGTVFGEGDNSTTFNLPDMRGRVAVGQDNMGGTPANRITNTGTGNPGIDGTDIGAAGGVANQGITVAQMPSHSHAPNATYNKFILFNAVNTPPVGLASGGGFAFLNLAVAAIETLAGSNVAHCNIQPLMISPFIIKT